MSKTEDIKTEKHNEHTGRPRGKMQRTGEHIAKEVRETNKPMETHQHVSQPHS